MYNYKRGAIISRDETLDFHHREYYKHDGLFGELDIVADDGVVVFDNKTPHPLLLKAYINKIYSDKKEEQEKFGFISERLMLNGFHTPEINLASFIASQGDVVILYLEIPEEEKKGSKYEGTGLTRSMMIYMPENRKFTELQENCLSKLDIDVEILGVAYVGETIDDVEIFSSYDAKEEMEYLKEEIEYKNHDGGSYASK